MPTNLLEDTKTDKCLCTRQKAQLLRGHDSIHGSFAKTSCHIRTGGQSG